MESRLPDIFVSMVLCRDILTGENGSATLLTVTNVVETTPHELISNDSPPKRLLFFTPIQTSLFLSVYSEMDHEEIQIDIRVRTPEGRIVKPEERSGSRSLSLRAGAAGLLFNMGLPFEAANPGLYWIEAYVENELKNKVPLNITVGEPIQIAAQFRSEETVRTQESNPQSDLEK